MVYGRKDILQIKNLRRLFLADAHVSRCVGFKMHFCHWECTSVKKLKCVFVCVCAYKEWLELEQF